MKSRRRLDIIKPVNDGDEWRGRVGGKAVTLWKARDEVQVWISKKDGGATFATLTVTEAIKTLEAM